MDKFFNGLPYFGNSSGSGHSVENTGNTNNLSNIPAGKITGLALCTSPASVFTMSNISPTGNESVVSNTSNDTKLTEPAFGTTSTFQIGPTMSSTLGQGQGYTLYGASTPFNSCTTSIQTPSLGSAQPPFQHTSTAASGFASGSSSVFSFRPSTVSSTKLPTAHESVVSTTSNGTNSTLEREGSSCGGCACNLISISAMPAYENKSHEELRWEDCQRQLHKGIGTSSTPTPSFNFGQHASTTGIGTSSTPTPSFNFGQHASTTGIGTSSAPTPSFSFVQHASTTGAPNFAGQNGHGASVFGATAGTSNASLTFGLPPCISTNTCCLHSPGSFPPASIHAFGPGGATHAHATNEAWRQSSIPSAHSNIMGMPVPLVGYGQNSFPGIMLILHPVVYNGQTTTSFSVLPLSAFSSSMANFSHSSAGGSKGQAVSFC
ncbi:nuclear pore complex protein NUP98A isoform X3 [Ziziphus jujuba]|uniref:Nuclear pore complex protein NUP98A isoform X3 n=1 Tax=Ziziphus jujuba TaxID=326968 RepID=A0ABM3ICA8_ZIZJJ|nr:nuclear pore complex protein NUP98A isoform X3 [Ziziphus jujuba]